MATFKVPRNKGTPEFRWLPWRSCARLMSPVGVMCGEWSWQDPRHAGASAIARVLARMHRIWRPLNRRAKRPVQGSITRSGTDHRRGSI
jgi:hypothetical protein